MDIRADEKEKRWGECLLMVATVTDESAGRNEKTKKCGLEYIEAVIHQNGIGPQQ